MPNVEVCPAKQTQAPMYRIKSDISANAYFGCPIRRMGLCMILKQQLKSILRSRDLTAAQLARKSGLPRQTISDWISGTPPRDIRQVKKIADVLGLTVDQLCFGSSLEKKSIREFEDEINAGIFEVVLRRVKR